MFHHTDGLTRQGLDQGGVPCLPRQHRVPSQDAVDAKRATEFALALDSEGEAEHHIEGTTEPEAAKDD